jgi:hypothetical protein
MPYHLTVLLYYVVLYLCDERTVVVNNVVVEMLLLIPGNYQPHVLSDSMDSVVAVTKVVCMILLLPTTQYDL